MLDHFYSLKPCCRDREFSTKLFELCPTAMQLSADDAMKKMLYTFACEYRFTDMWSERLLARIRKASDGKECCIERVCSSGFVTQFVTEHLQMGRADPRAATRAQLLADGVSLRCKQREGGASRPRSAFVNFLLKADEERKKQGVMMDKDAYATWRRGKVREWHANPLAQKQVEEQEAFKAYLDKQAAEDDEEQTIRSRSSVSSVVDTIGDERSPYKIEAFRARIKDALGINDGNRDPGFTRYSGVFREQQREGLFVQEVGAVPADTKYSYALPCTMAHPGICATDDVQIVDKAKVIADSMFKAFASCKVGTFFHMRVSVGGAWTRTTWFAFCHQRGSGPRMIMVAPASFTTATRRLNINFQDSLYDFMMAISFVGLILKDAPVDPDVVVQLARAPVDEASLTRKGDEVVLHPDWRNQVLGLETTIYPVLAGIPVDGKAAAMTKGLKRACERLPKRRSDAADGVRVVRPVAVPAGQPPLLPPPGLPPPADRDSTDGESDDGGSNRSGRSESDDDGGGLPGDDDGGHPAPPVPAAPRPDDEMVAAIPRGRDGAPWRHWKVGGYGFIVWDAEKQSFGAHCSKTPCHGKLCRANKVAKRCPLGYLVAWLMLPHLDAEISDRPKHKAAQQRLCSELGYDQRRAGRTWLTDRPHAFDDMLDLERPHHRGPIEEPFRVMH